MATVGRPTEYKKEDWSYWSKTSDKMIEMGYGKEQFERYTLRHKLRLLLGIHGSIEEKYYFYNFMNGRCKLFNFLVNLIPSL